MRFKARLSNEKLNHFHGVLLTLEKICSKCVVQLSPERILMSGLRDPKLEDVMPFADLSKDIFDEWKIESQSNNCILFELSLQNMLDALNSAKKAPVCQMKLTKRNGQAVLCIETRAMEIDIVHDIRVTVMAASDYEHYSPPETPIPQVQLELPTSKGFKIVVDRLRNISRNLFLHGKMSGSLTLRVVTEAVAIKTFFTNLNPRYEQFPDIDSCTGNTCTVKVDSKKLSMLLHAYTLLRFNSIVFCMIPNHSVVLHILLEPVSDGFLTFFLPIVPTTCDEDDEYESDDMDN